MTTTTAGHAVAEVQAVVSLLLRYPTAELVAECGRLDASVAHLPHAQRDRLRGFLAHITATPLDRLQQDYVATFDLKRKCCLYLSYYLNGDTRLRGMALVSFQEVYRAAGLTVSSEELPDYLPMVLEFAATVDPDMGEALLVQHRRGLAVLRLALAGLGSAYAPLIEAVEGTLPPPGDSDGERVVALATHGPPTELVGLEPFGPPELTGWGVRS